ncbi:4-coumarate-CoA ligase [Histoplasma capsulatum H143]|uniref:4-coumarate-CoA ligase n=1 Tax=Ajellomyces capsulatus (strain H143) TaxID=544712 RepID=C6H7I4_AJECH|nr:4-coumarate-CoA ligase [Histoplasma capsulatum H143]
MVILSKRPETAKYDLASVKLITCEACTVVAQAPEQGISEARGYSTTRAGNDRGNFGCYACSW